MLTNLSTRIAASLIAILIFAIGLTAVLNYYKVEESFSDLTRSRFSFLVLDMQETLETGMNLGLPLRDLDNVPELLAQQATLNSDILSIEVFDPTGTVIFGTDSSFMGDLVAADWQAAWPRSEDTTWSVSDKVADTIGISLNNSLGQTEGILALRYSLVPEQAVLRALAFELAGWGVVIVVVSALVAFFGATLVLRPTSARLLDMQKSITAATGPGGADSPPAPTRDPQDGFAGFMKASREAEAELSRSADEIHRLDREG